jgi:ArsR family transcriptional regulator
MTTAERNRLERRAALLKSLAHPSRLLIIEMLEEAPRCVGELTKAIGADMTTVSKHLSVLKRAGLVRDAKHGTYSEYTLVCDCVTHLIDCIEDGMEDDSGGAANKARATDRKQSCTTRRKSTKRKSDRSS